MQKSKGRTGIIKQIELQKSEVEKINTINKKRKDNMQDKINNLAQRLLDYAAECIKLISKLDRNYAQKYIISQLVRASTSAGANYEEARSAESRADFVHKIQISLKELRESLYWLKLIVRAGLVPAKDLEVLNAEANELIRIFAKSVITAKCKK